MGQEMLTLSRRPDFTPFWAFMNPPIHNTCIYIKQNLLVLELCLLINDSGLFAWIVFVLDLFFDIFSHIDNNRGTYEY